MLIFYFMLILLVDSHDVIQETLRNFEKAIDPALVPVCFLLRIPFLVMVMSP